MPRGTMQLHEHAGITVEGPPVERQSEVLTHDALRFLGELERRFRAPLDSLLARRAQRRARLAAGDPLGLLPETAAIRGDDDWRVAPPAPGLTLRVVEITGPPERKMIINALNSGADVFMADFEDACSPTWANLIGGQVNLMDAVRRTITWEHPETRRRYELAPRTATPVVRPRGLHLSERHVTVDGTPVAAPWFDFALAFFHNARELVRRGAGPYFYLPKLESHLEARLWNDVFLFAQDHVGIPRGTIRATVLIETLPAVFEMDEILHELREHSSGLNCGRWDYIFSFIKCRRHDPRSVLPDRSQVTMDQPFLRAWSRLVIRTCHRRGAYAIGGMAAQIPNRSHEVENQRALERVRADKRREAADGHDGTWVAHPDLVPVARAEFESLMVGSNQIHRPLPDPIGPDRLLEVPPGTRTEEGLRHNVRVGVRYLEAWLSGQGCVPLYGLMEDAATAEISRAQVWQWVRHRARLADGTEVTRSRVERVVKEEVEGVRSAAGWQGNGGGRLDQAAALFLEVATGEELEEFLTHPAYDQLVREGGEA